MRGHAGPPSGVEAGEGQSDDEAGHLLQLADAVQRPAYRRRPADITDQLADEAQCRGVVAAHRHRHTGPATAGSAPPLVSGKEGDALTTRAPGASPAIRTAVDSPVVPRIMSPAVRGPARTVPA